MCRDPVRRTSDRRREMKLVSVLTINGECFTAYRYVKVPKFVLAQRTLTRNVQMGCMLLG